MPCFTDTVPRLYGVSLGAPVPSSIEESEACSQSFDYNDTGRNLWKMLGSRLSPRLDRRSTRGFAL